MYLTPADYRAVVTPEDQEVLSYGYSSQMLDSSETACRAEAESYLRAYARARFDLNRIFIPVTQWDENSDYSAGMHVYAPDGDEISVYTAIQGGSGNPVSDSVYWLMQDSRHPLVKLYLADMSVYHLFSKIMPDNIPELRLKRYARAVKFWQDVRDGTADPEFPLEQNTDAPRWGSNKRKRWFL
jgi:hypothetical protein